MSRAITLLTPEFLRRLVAVSRKRWNESPPPWRAALRPLPVSRGRGSRFEDRLQITGVRALHVHPEMGFDVIAITLADGRHVPWFDKYDDLTAILRRTEPSAEIDLAYLVRPTRRQILTLGKAGVLQLSDPRKQIKQSTGTIGWQ